eukprot:gnl/MRDRNA2_/MRDRNA2_90282_c0_seq1.p1 gnl/MRDRNA2_/MRDRNA2_90282_c0~~gnl/MRDRNA2_/MRDRNA2_90282_c0_seq1.p1  ORF type:complete len:656 (-),score=147.68 gnl/MRDRNA2_/MRDRNA2_90282_c0_seq1:116-2083(-)
MFVQQAMSWNSQRWSLAAQLSFEQAKNAFSEAAEQVQVAKDAASGAVQNAVHQIENAAHSTHKNASEQVQFAKDAASGAVQNAVHKIESAAQSTHKNTSFSVVQAAYAASEAVQQATGATSGAARHAVQAISAASDVAQKAVGSASAMALTAGSQAHKSSVEAVTALYSKDPEDLRGTVVCSELLGPLVIAPGPGRLQIVEAWYGHHSDHSRRRNVTDEVQAFIAYEEKGYSLELSTSRRFWGVDATEPFPHVLSVTYHREVTDEPTPGEVIRKQCAHEAVHNAVLRARYELLKQIGGSPMMGSWIQITPMLMGLPVPGKSLHAIYVSTAEVISWTSEGGLQVQTYLSFLHDNGVSEIQVLQRPPSMQMAEKIAEYVRSLIRVKMPRVNAVGQPVFKDSRAFCAHCHCPCLDTDPNAVLTTAGTFAAAVAVAAHVDEAAAAVTLPLAGAAHAAAVGLFGATVVSPLALGGLWYLQRRNNARLSLAIVNRAAVPISVSAFELGDAQCAEWGPLRSSCTSIGGQTSGLLGVGQLFELNPPSSSQMYQLRCVTAHADTKGDKDTSVQKDEDTALQDGTSSNSDLAVVVEVGDDSLSCAFVERGCVYQITQQANALVVTEVPQNFIPAYAQTRLETCARSLPVVDELNGGDLDAAPVEE